MVINTTTILFWRGEKLKDGDFHILQLTSDLKLGQIITKTRPN